jgi:hypothetical protein
MKFLKSDTTWQPELLNENKYLLRANKDLHINVGDFEDYLTGINFEVPKGFQVVFTSLMSGLVTNSSLIESNYYSEKSTIARLVNKSNEIIDVAETEYILSFELIDKENINTQPVESKGNTSVKNTFQEPTAEPVQEPTAEPVQEPTAEPVQEPTAEPVQEPTAEPVQEPTAEPVQEPTAEPVQEPVQEPTAEPVQEPVQEPTAVQPKKRKYVRRTT